MYCAYCGSETHQGQSFCSRCGKPVANSATGSAANATSGVSAATPTPPSTAPPAPQPAWTASSGYIAQPPRSRLQSHLRTLGILWIVGSALRMIPSLGMLLFGRMGFLFMPMPARAFMLPLIGGIGAFMTVACVAGIAAGWGLIDRRPWARSLAIVLGCLALIDFPFGTALGIYTLWVLFSTGADVEYDRLSNRVIG
jgi:hypothetical protein